eukprot:266165-Amphidinium_carterae.1
MLLISARPPVHLHMVENSFTLISVEADMSSAHRSSGLWLSKGPPCVMGRPPVCCPRLHTYGAHLSKGSRPVRLDLSGQAATYHHTCANSVELNCCTCLASR